MKLVIDIPLNVVDLHICAITTPEANEDRFIASADGVISMTDIAELLRQKRPNLIAKMPKKALPNFAIKVVALFNK